MKVSDVFLFLPLFFAVIPGCGDLPNAVHGDIASTTRSDGVYRDDATLALTNLRIYQARSDTRKCASPMCGGYFLHELNKPKTLCYDGTQKTECYVENLDFSELDCEDISTPIYSVLLEGILETVLEVHDIWIPYDDTKPQGQFYQIINDFLVCVRAPCFNLSEIKVNTTKQMMLSGLRGNNDRVSSALARLRHDDIIVSGYNLTLRAHEHETEAGKELFIKQFYTRKNF